MEIAHIKSGVIMGDSSRKDYKNHGKVKHIDICHHYLCELVKSNLIIFEQIPSAANIIIVS